MLFTGNDASGFLCGFQDEIFIQRFDRVHIDHAGGDALGLQLVGSLERDRDHDAVGDDRDITALFHRNALAEFKAVAIDRVGHDLGGGTLQTQIGRAFVIDECFHGQLHLVPVAGAADEHAGDGAHEREVLYALMGRSVFTHGDAAMRTHDGHIESGVGDGVADLLIGAPCRKNGEGVGEGLQSAGREAGSDAGHVCFGNAAVKKPVGVFRGKEFAHGRAGKVGVENNKLRILFSKLCQGFAVGIAGRDFVSHLISPPVLLFSLQARLWRWRTAPHWGLSRASRPDSP